MRSLQRLHDHRLDHQSLWFLIFGVFFDFYYICDKYNL